MLTAAGHFPDTPSKRTCESRALPVLRWELASHTRIHLPPKEPGNLEALAQPWLIPCKEPGNDGQPSWKDAPRL